MQTPLIQSPQNARVKAAVKLRRGKHRRQSGRTLIDGVREIDRALDGSVPIVEAFICPRLCKTPEAQALAQRLEGLEAPRYEVTESVFAKLAFGERTEGILIVAAPKATELADLKLPENPLIAVTESLEKPGNLGAILRSADGAGVSAVLAAAESTDLFNPNTIRASLGTIFTKPVAAADAATIRDWLVEHKIPIYAARVDGAIDYWQADFKAPAAIVLGAEATGLSDQWQGDDVTAVRIPMRGTADSLNVSAAAALLFYEALRQRSV